MQLFFMLYAPQNHLLDLCQQWANEIISIGSSSLLHELTAHTSIYPAAKYYT